MRHPVKMLFAATAALAMLAAPSTAGASIEISSPTAARIIAVPGAKIRLTVKTSCPDGYRCGRFGTELEPGSVVYIGKGTAITNNGEGAIFDDYEQGTSQDPVLGYDSFRVSGNKFNFNLDDSMTAGVWGIVASWKECKIPTDGAEISDNDCTIVHGEIKRLFVRPVVGVKKYKLETRQGLSNEIKRGAFISTTFGCNTTRQSYRMNVTLQKRVKVGKRYTWRTVSVRRNQRANDKYYGLQCTSYFHVPVPSSVSDTTKLRQQLRVWSVNKGLRAFPRTVTSKAWTMAELRKNAGGPIIITS